MEARHFDFDALTRALQSGHPRRKLVRAALAAFAGFGLTRPPSRAQEAAAGGTAALRCVPSESGLPGTPERLGRNLPGPEATQAVTHPPITHAVNPRQPWACLPETAPAHGHLGRIVESARMRGRCGWLGI